MASNDLRTGLEKATDAVRDVTDAVQATTDSISAAIEDSREPGGLLNQMARFTREAPLRSVGIAFLAGLLVSRLR